LPKCVWEPYLHQRVCQVFLSAGSLASFNVAAVPFSQLQYISDAHVSRPTFPSLVFRNADQHGSDAGYRRGTPEDPVKRQHESLRVCLCYRHTSRL
jgi:hypothetical protein